MLVLFTDFGLQGPYVGQIKSVLRQLSPLCPVIDLMHDAPAFNPKASAYLLASLIDDFPAGSIFIAVIDPGVGTDLRLPCIVKADGRWFVGPGNGLFYAVINQATQVEAMYIQWRPENLSSSFHGRDLFAPVAAMLANGVMPESEDYSIKIDREKWPDELAEIIYIDNFGNAMTGIRASSVNISDCIRIAGQELCYQTTFANAEIGQAFWYINSNNMVELAVNQGSAKERLGLRIGSGLKIINSPA